MRLVLRIDFVLGDEAVLVGIDPSEEIIILVCNELHGHNQGRRYDDAYRDRAHD
ncbi:MAG TPA: hypothetical protein VMM76_14390 [Pirellulaceae bacterium]|nr:hypothetical protein [Pirellulaceae bacterium]